MKHKTPLCLVCKDTGNSIPLAVDNMENVIICHTCGHRLHRSHELDFEMDGEKFKFKVDGMRGDFKIINCYRVIEEPTPDPFETQKAVADHAAQCGWDFIIGNPSY